MSDPIERPADPDGDGVDRGAAARPEADAWAVACEEDLAAERARRRTQYGNPPLDAVEELRRLADAVVDKIAQFGAPIAGTVASSAAQGAARQLFAQAKAVVEPVVERNPGVFDHLAAAGQELLAAYRSAVENQESRWTRTSGESGPAAKGSEDRSDKRDKGGYDDGPAGSERIDLD